MILKADVSTEEDNDEKELCYLAQHKAKEKPFDTISCSAQRHSMILTFVQVFGGGADEVIEIFCSFPNLSVCVLIKLLRILITVLNMKG